MLPPETIAKLDQAVCQNRSQDMCVRCVFVRQIIVNVAKEVGRITPPSPELTKAVELLEDVGLLCQQAIHPVEDCHESKDAADDGTAGV